MSFFSFPPAIFVFLKMSLKENRCAFAAPPPDPAEHAGLSSETQSGSKKYESQKPQNNMGSVPLCVCMCV